MEPPKTSVPGIQRCPALLPHISSHSARIDLQESETLGSPDCSFCFEKNHLKQKHHMNEYSYPLKRKLCLFFIVLTSKGKVGIVIKIPSLI